MCKVKEQFIQNLIKELNSVNRNRIYYDKTPLDICYMVSVVNQHIEKCKEFIDEITNHTYCINGYDDMSSGYTNGRIRILIEKPDSEKESDYLIGAYYYDYCYYIEFLYDERDWGYCQCSPNDKNYNKKHDCCGMGCDWTAPAFRLTKEIDLQYGKWNGYEKDYWEYEDKFNENENNKNKEVEEYKKQESIKYIKSQIEELQNKLKELEK